MVNITLAQSLEIIELIKIYECLLYIKDYPFQKGYGIDGGTGDGYGNGIKYRDGCGGGCGIGNHNGEGFSDPFGDSFGNGVGVMLCGYIDGDGYGSEYMKENSND